MHTHVPQAGNGVFTSAVDDLGILGGGHVTTNRRNAIAPNQDRLVRDLGSGLDVNNRDVADQQVGMGDGRTETNRDESLQECIHLAFAANNARRSRSSAIFVEKARMRSRSPGNCTGLTSAPPGPARPMNTNPTLSPSGP